MPPDRRTRLGRDVLEAVRLKGCMAVATTKQGLVALEGDDLYSQYMMMGLPRQDTGVRTDPKLMMCRCEWCTAEIGNIIAKQAFETSQRREVPHRGRKGPAAESWDGWARSNRRLALD